MHLNHLIIEHYARIPYAEFSFGKCNPIVGKGAWRLAVPLGVLVGNRFADVLPTPYAFCQDSRFYAAFEADGVQYSAEAVYDENAPSWRGRAPRGGRCSYFPTGGRCIFRRDFCGTRSRSRRGIREPPRRTGGYPDYREEQHGVE